MSAATDNLINAGVAMLNGKGWHEIDGDCSICQNFRKALEAAIDEQSSCTCKRVERPDGKFTIYHNPWCKVHPTLE